MTLKYRSLELAHAPTPQIQHFAILAGLEAAVRGILITTIPLAVYDALGSAQSVSSVYFATGLITLFWGLLVPRMTQLWARRWVYSGGCALYLVAMVLFVMGQVWSVPLGILVMGMATVTCFVCFNAYVLDYVARVDLGRTQSTQMVYSAIPWAVGPMTGVYLHEWHSAAPFVVAGIFALLQVSVFWFLRLGNGKQITRAAGSAVNPLQYLGRFFRQPRLIAGWLFAVIRSCGWWVYVVYVPIFCIEAGLGKQLGGIMLSLTNATLLLSPFMAAWVRRRSVRVSLRFSLAYCMIFFIAATACASVPALTVMCLFAGSFGLVMLDVVGGLPFMMSVKPSERGEMAAVFSSFRDVSGIATPGIASLVLWVAPLNFIFASAGMAFAAAFIIAGKLHPRLGTARPSVGSG
jgi:ACDE family multidrug resistance protein